MRWMTLLVLASAALAQGRTEVEQLVDALALVEQPGPGYSGTSAGHEFAPHADSRNVGMRLLGSRGPARSATIEAIVAKGIVAVPTLLAHLDDARATKVPPQQAMMFLSVGNEYDFNTRVRKNPPQGVNVDASAERARSFQVRVGDLCFVALGQILNERWSACRYQATGGLIVNSPVDSKRLREVLRADYGTLDRAGHRAKLVQDLTLSDSETRRNGAIRRLAYYYPAAVEPLVLVELERATWNVHAVHHVCRDVLYKRATKAQRRVRLDRFLKEQGPGAMDGVREFLFTDLVTQENLDSGRWKTSHRWFEDQPRRLLIELFGYGPEVQSTDRPWPKGLPSAEQARFIEALRHTKSKKIDAAVHAILQGAGDDDSLLLGCMKMLLGRGHDKTIRAHCERRMGKVAGYTQHYRAILEQLPR